MKLQLANVLDEQKKLRRKAAHLATKIVMRVRFERKPHDVRGPVREFPKNFVLGQTFLRVYGIGQAQCRIAFGIRDDLPYAFA